MAGGERGQGDKKQNTLATLALEPAHVLIRGSQKQEGLPTVKCLSGFAYMCIEIPICIAYRIPTPRFSADSSRKPAKKDDFVLVS